MADIEYDVSYLARSPASMRQDDFAEMIDELCNGRAASGWQLFNAMGDYGAKVTLGVWLIFSREPGSGSDRFAATADIDEPARDTAGMGDDAGAPAASDRFAATTDIDEPAPEPAGIDDDAGAPAAEEPPAEDEESL
jgi:hypothetical protein